MEESRTAIVAAFLANLGIALAKLVGFLATGAASLAAEAVHSLVVDAVAGRPSPWPGVVLDAVVEVGDGESGVPVGRAAGEPSGSGRDHPEGALALCCVVAAKLTQ